MAGGGRFLVTARTMQRLIGTLHAELGARATGVSAGWNALMLGIADSWKFTTPALDPELQSEHPELEREAALSANWKAVMMAKELSQSEMSKIISTVLVPVTLKQT
jgi:hypothetical protein